MGDGRWETDDLPTPAGSDQRGRPKLFADSNIQS
ncbi:hypothetical protein GPROT1_02500 [Gammaproteobacteria bacterium]|nr:hypothetical protein GPROT1_02500 [Gammaproteobacteria bacterium]